MARHHQGLPQYTPSANRESTTAVSCSNRGCTVGHEPFHKYEDAINFTTGCQRLKKGIMAGCTVSVILFVAAMNMLLKAGLSQCRGPKADDGTRHPSYRAFMDDVTIMTEFLDSFSPEKIKPAKSRGLTIIKGHLGSHVFIIQGEIIPTIQDESIKYLGKCFDQSLEDPNNSRDA